MKLKNYKNVMLAGIISAALINAAPAYATVGIPSTTSDQQDTTEDSGSQDLQLESSSGNVTVGIPGQEGTDEGEGASETPEGDSGDSSDSGDMGYDPYEQSSEVTEVNQANMDLLASLKDSWDEDPGGSTYTDDYAYYKIGSLSGQPEIHAPSAILMDAGSGVVLCNKNGKEKKYPASMTKIMTALIALENGSPDDMITYSENAVNNLPQDATKAGFSVGDTATLQESLYALFMSSAADAAVAIAEYYGGDVSTFVRMMNEKATSIGCEGTNFANPHGLHDENHYTTAYDMALIMQNAILNEDFNAIIAEKSYTITDGVKTPIQLENRSALLSEGNANYYEFAKGSKTGHTEAAKYTLASYAQKNNETLISIVMEEENFDNSYGDSKKLFEWGYQKTQVLNPLPSADTIEPILQEAMSGDKFEKIKLLSLKYIPDYGIITNTAINKNEVRSFFVMDEDMENGILGYLNVSYYNKILIGRTPVLYETDTEGYTEYISYYGMENSTPPIITGDGEEGSVDIGGNIEDSSSSEYVDRYEEEEEPEVPLTAFNEGIMDLGIKFYIIRGSLILIACIIAYVVIFIRRKKGY